MKFYTAIPKSLEPYYKAELERYRAEFANGNLKAAWTHLEWAHIIRQKYPYAHTYVHWKRLQFGFKIKSSKEVLGQIPRLLFGGVKSFVGTIQIGNPGGANVPPLKPFPLKEEVQKIFVKAGVDFG